MYSKLLPPFVLFLVMPRDYSIIVIPKIKFCGLGTVTSMADDGRKIFSGTKTEIYNVLEVISKFTHCLFQYVN